MLARLLRRLIALGVAFILLMIFGLWNLSSWLVGLPILMFLSALAVTMAIQCVAAENANRRDQVPKVAASQLLQAWLQETWVAAKVFFWWQPFRSNVFPDSQLDGARAASHRGVVFVHGFVCNRGVWNAWYPLLKRRLIPYEAINLEPPFASIDSYVCLLDEAVTRMRDRTGENPLVVCHSMGGLAVRAWLRASNADARVHRIVTIGSPHHGTRICNWAPQVSAVANAQQMRLGSNWLKFLAKQEDTIRRAQFVCFYSNCDNIVFPATNATLDDADNRHVPGVPHLALAMHRSVIAQSLALL